MASSVIEILCAKCGAPIPDHVDRCVGCAADVGFPNVRAARREEQVSALKRRYRRAKRQSALRGVDKLVNLLEAQLKQSVAVICKPWGEINTFLRRNNRLLETFHQDVEAEARMPERNEFDRFRAGIDATFFP